MANRTLLGVTAIAMFVSMLCAGIHAADTSTGKSKLSVTVTILPLEWFVERIGGDAVDVQVLVGPGKSPAVYEPTPKQMTELSQADILFAIGVPFERAFLGDVGKLNPGLRVIRLNELVYDKSGKENTESETRDDHPDSRIDPHIWLDPIVAKSLAGIIADELSKSKPELAERFQSSLKSLEDDLDSLNTELSGLLKPLRGRRFYVFHPAFGHFGNRYGLKQIAIEHEGKEPAARELAKLIDQAKKDKVKSVFVQEQFADNSAKTIASAIGAKIVRLDPLSSDYINNLIYIAKAIHESLTE